MLALLPLLLQLLLFTVHVTSLPNNNNRPLVPPKPLHLTPAYKLNAVKPPPVPPRQPPRRQPKPQQDSLSDDAFKGPLYEQLSKLEFQYGSNLKDNEKIRAGVVFASTAEKRSGSSVKSRFEAAVGKLTNVLKILKKPEPLLFVGVDPSPNEPRLNPEGELRSELKHAFSLVEENIDTEGIFRLSPSESKYKKILSGKEPVDTLNENDVHVASRMIKQSLKNTIQNQDEVLKNVDNPKVFYQEILKNSGQHAKYIEKVFDLLTSVSQHSDKNNMGASNLARLVTPNLFDSLMVPNMEEMSSVQTLIEKPELRVRLA